MKKVLLSLFFCLFAAFVSAATNDALEKARNLYSAKKYDEALKVLVDFDQSHPDDLAANDLIQRIYEKQGKREDAIALYKARYEKTPTAFNGYLYIRMLDVPSEQEKLLRDAIAKDPKSVWGFYGLVNSLMDQDRLQDGIEEGGKGLLVVTQPSRLHYVVARTYRRMKDYRNAATQAHAAYMLDPSQENADLWRAYSWMVVSNEKDRAEQFRLAQQWYRQNSKTVFSDDMETSTVTELCYIFAENGFDSATVKKLAAAGLKALAEEEKTGISDEDAHYRAKGALLAITAWSDAKAKQPGPAHGNLKSAEKTGSGPETFFFTAHAYRDLADKERALEFALKAATYPPVYRGSKDLALAYWKEVHATDAGFDDAFQKQRDLFSEERKTKVLSHRVEEKFEPFEMTDASGKVYSEKDVAGKTVLINFWAVWCPPCREELPHWNEFYAKHKNDPGLQLIAVGDEPWETMQNYLKNHGYDFALFRNEKYWDQFSVAAIPTLLVVDSTGTIRFRDMGFEEGMEYEETLLWQIEAAKGATNAQTE